jgi:hypothetical protein
LRFAVLSRFYASGFLLGEFVLFFLSFFLYLFIYLLLFYLVICLFIILYIFSSSYVPGGMTGEQQPLDIATNRPFKAHLQRNFVSWFAALSADMRLRAGSLPVLKSKCVEWVCSAAEHVRANSEAMVVAGWQKAGLHAIFDADTQEKATKLFTEQFECEAEPSVDDFLNPDAVARMQSSLGAELNALQGTQASNVM